MYSSNRPHHGVQSQTNSFHTAANTGYQPGLHHHTYNNTQMGYSTNIIPNGNFNTSPNTNYPSNSCNSLLSNPTSGNYQQQFFNLQQGQSMSGQSLLGPVPGNSNFPTGQPMNNMFRNSLRSPDLIGEQMYNNGRDGQLRDYSSLPNNISNQQSSLLGNPNMLSSHIGPRITDTFPKKTFKKESNSNNSTRPNKNHSQQHKPVASSNNKQINLTPSPKNSPASVKKEESKTKASNSAITPTSDSYQQMLRVRDANKRNVELATKSLTALATSKKSEDDGKSLKRQQDEAEVVEVESETKKVCVNTILMQVKCEAETLPNNDVDDCVDIFDLEAVNERLEVPMESEEEPAKKPLSPPPLPDILVCRSDPHIVSVSGVLSSAAENFSIRGFYCQSCCWFLNDEQTLKQHLYTVQHRTNATKKAQ